MELLSKTKCFDGYVEFYQHWSDVCQCPMRFSVYRPPQIRKYYPTLYWLSGLTCTDENFMIKAGAQRALAQRGILCIVPDTSPRNLNLPNEGTTWDLGLGAGFYVDAIQKPWAPHYHMYSYVSEELPRIAAMHFGADPEKRSIFGHSMGGHGALVIGLRNRERYAAISALAPICSPTTSPRGIRAFSAYLGTDQTLWKEYDAARLIQRDGLKIPIRVDQGDQDEFYLDGMLQPEALKDAAAKATHPVDLRFHPGYGHNYYFVASFIEEHIAFHAEAMGNF